MAEEFSHTVIHRKALGVLGSKECLLSNLSNQLQVSIPMSHFSDNVMLCKSSVDSMLISFNMPGFHY